MNLYYFLDIRDLYELILEKELLADAYGQPQHRMVRKNSRSPSLRLRFGRRSDPSFYQVNTTYPYAYYLRYSINS